jgi:hypothetical protein
MRMNKADRATLQLMFTQSSASAHAFKVSFAHLNARADTTKGVCDTLTSMAVIVATIGLWYGNAPTPAVGKHEGATTLIRVTNRKNTSRRKP